MAKHLSLASSTASEPAVRPNFPPREAVLVSVRDAAELEMARKYGFHWIDLKEPSHGSLGCPSADTTKEILEAAQSDEARETCQPNRIARLSIALGDIEDSAELPLPASYLKSLR